MTARKTKMVDQDGCQIKIIHQDRVTLAREASPDQATLSRMSLLYKALGDPNRLKILMALTGGEMCVCDLGALMDVTDSAVSHQLRRLREQALVKTRRDGQVLYYSLDDDHVDQLLRMGLDHVNE